MINPEVPFGSQFRKKYFTSFDKDLVNLNHGSFGATTTDILNQKFNIVKQLASFPDVFYRETLTEVVTTCRELISEFINCNFDELVFLNNATTAVNSVLRSYPFKENDIIINFNVNYLACRNTIDFVTKEKNLKNIEIQVTFPISDEEIVSKFEKVLLELPEIENRTVLLFMDGICATPGIRFPWESLVNICNKRNVLSFVDGAHQIGIREIDIKKHRPDFFTSNLHKWLYVPNSVALLYVDPKHHTKIKPLPISNTYNTSKFADQYTVMSTLDYSSMATIPAALNFRREVCGGEKRIMDYHTKLAKEAIDLILKKWPGSKMLGDLNSVTTMFNIVLPVEKHYDFYDFIDFVSTYLLRHGDKKTYIPIFVYDDQVVSRWSVEIYLEISDYNWGIDKIKKAYNAFERERAK